MNAIQTKLADVPQAAQILGVPRSWLYGHIHAGTLPFPVIRVGRYVRFRESDIHDYIDKQAQAQRGGEAA